MRGSGNLRVERLIQEGKFEHNELDVLSFSFKCVVFEAGAKTPKRIRYGGNPTSHTPAHNVPAVAAAFRL